MPKLVLAAERSTVRLHTFAEGLLARLAHDLELRCSGGEGTGELVDDAKGSATLVFPIAKIEVGGTLKDGRVDANGISASDRVDCLAKMRKDVFHVRGDEGSVRVEATLDAGRARFRITPPSGRTVESTASVRLILEEGTTCVSGRCTISLAALGSDPVKGPMNAFRVKDAVDVVFDAVFVSA